MRPDDAVRVLTELEQQDVAGLSKQAAFLEWRSKCLSVLRGAFGASSEHVREFESAVVVKREGYTLAKGPMRDQEAFQQDAAHRGRGVLRAAVFALETLSGDSLLDGASIDPELWAHVQGLIADDDWVKVPAAVAIFLEDKVRTWAGDPRSGKGEVIVGTALYAAAMKSDGSLRLGGQANEQEG